MNTVDYTFPSVVISTVELGLQQMKHAFDAESATFRLWYIFLNGGVDMMAFVLSGFDN